MDRCDVLVVGGGPAGSSCAWKLRRAGFDVVVIDRAQFPRDKVCAGWITPQVVAALGLDLDAYGRSRTLQPIAAFRVGAIGAGRDIEVRYGRPVSFGIRRCEFDHYLLERSTARLQLGAPVTNLRRDDGLWIANDRVAAPMLVGAGGHWCPVARLLNPQIERTPLVVAQEAEFPIDRGGARGFTTVPDTPELFFSPDLTGYGWCFRKGGYANIGYGQLNGPGMDGRGGLRTLPGCASATDGFMSFLKARRKIPADAPWSRHGHAYLVATPRRRRVSGDGVLLVGDAAGLAYPQSGEGIRPAVESGLLAASTIIAAGRTYSREGLLDYERRLWARLPAGGESRGAPAGDRPGAARAPWAPIAARLSQRVATSLLRMPWFVHHVVLDRWFLRAADPPLMSSPVVDVA